MKKISIVLVLCMGIFVGGCEKRSVSVEVDKDFGSEHKLRKMSEVAGENSKVWDGFFIFLHDSNGSGKSQTLAKFSWQTKDGSYAFSSLPLGKIRVKFDEKVTTPTIKFTSCTSVPSVEEHFLDLQDFMDRCVLDALVTVNINYLAPVELQLEGVKLEKSR